MELDFDPDEFAHGLSQLIRLRGGDRTNLNPDYNIAGVANAYAFAYLGKRATSIVGAIQVAGAGAARRVLDVGCGSGAGELALSITNPSASVLAVDRSTEMLAFARRLDYGHCLRANWRQGTLERLGVLESGQFDLILISLCLDYRVPYDWPRIVDQIDARLANGGILIAIEPQGTKSEQLRSLKAALRGRRIVATWSCDSEYESYLRGGHELRQVTDVVRRYQHRVEKSSSLAEEAMDLLKHPESERGYSYVARSWNAHGPADIVLVATKAPPTPL